MGCPGKCKQDNPAAVWFSFGPGGVHTLLLELAKTGGFGEFGCSVAPNQSEKIPWMDKTIYSYFQGNRIIPGFLRW